jgi:hypothetical protein
MYWFKFYLRIYLSMTLDKLFSKYEIQSTWLQNENTTNLQRLLLDLNKQTCIKSIF